MPIAICYGWGMGYLRSVTASGLALGAALCVSGPAAAERPVADFARLPAIAGPELSPNGKQIIARAAQNGAQKIVIFNTDRSGESTVIDADKGDLNWYRWVNNEWLIANVGNVALDTGFYVTRIVAFRADGSKMHYVQQKEVGQHAGDVIWQANDGSTRILLASQKSVYASDPDFWPEVSMVDVATNKFDKVVWPKEGVMSWYADGSGAVRVGIGEENGGRDHRLLYRDRAQDGFRVVARTGEGKTGLPVPVLFLAEPGKAAAFSDKNGRTALYMLDLATMQTGAMLYEAPEHDLDSLIADPAETQIRGVRYTDTRRRTVWFDPKMQQIQAGLEQAFSGKQVQIVSQSADEQTFVIRESSPSVPGSYYTLSLGIGKLAMLGMENPAIGNQPLAPVKTISYTARDGMKLNAVLTLPSTGTSKNLPLIVLPHGGPRARDYEHWDFWTQFLADRGYAVLQPNYRGSTGFGAAYTAAGDGEWGLKMQDDVDDARAWAVSTGLADGKRVCIAGGSYGGYVAMRAAERNPDLYRCAISFAGVSDLPAILRFDSQFVGGLGNLDYWKSRAPDLRAVSPITNAERTGIPILVIHGKKDLRVPLAQSKDYVDKLKKAGKPVEFFIQPEGDHHFSREEDRLSFLSQMEAFLDKHNPAN